MRIAVGTAGITEDIASSANKLSSRPLMVYPFEEGVLNLPLADLLSADAGHDLHMRMPRVLGVHQLHQACQEFLRQTLSVHKRQVKPKFVPGALAGEYS